eukprot:Sspe_Gene.56906::Locus_31266_Transcript_5_7_Confidence_0.348_Length_2184::g.56906::m.56906
MAPCPRCHQACRGLCQARRGHTPAAQRVLLAIGSAWELVATAAWEALRLPVCKAVGNGLRCLLWEPVAALGRGAGHLGRCIVRPGRRMFLRCLDGMAEYLLEPLSEAVERGVLRALRPVLDAVKGAERVARFLRSLVVIVREVCRPVVQSLLKPVEAVVRLAFRPILRCLEAVRGVLRRVEEGVVRPLERALTTLVSLPGRTARGVWRSAVVRGMRGAVSLATTPLVRLVVPYKPSLNAVEVEVVNKDTVYMTSTGFNFRIERTFAVPDGSGKMEAPPSLGVCKVFRVADHMARSPPELRELVLEGVEVLLVPGEDREAFWLSFSTDGQPTALRIEADGVNVVTGGDDSVKEDYLVVPPQKWVDGVRDPATGTVKQFVVTKEGSYTLAGQTGGRMGTGLTIDAHVRRAPCDLGRVVMSRSCSNPRVSCAFFMIDTPGDIIKEGIRNLHDVVVVLLNARQGDHHDYLQKVRDELHPTPVLACRSCSPYSPEVKAALLKHLSPIPSADVYNPIPVKIVYDMGFQLRSQSYSGTIGCDFTFEEKQYMGYGIGVGGEVHQKFESDPLYWGKDGWDWEHKARVHVRFLPAAVLSSIVGVVDRPTLPRAPPTYQAPRRMIVVREGRFKSVAELDREAADDVLWNGLLIPRDIVNHIMGFVGPRTSATVRLQRGLTAVFDLHAGGWQVE